jgi:hypothetical protein
MRLKAFGNVLALGCLLILVSGFARPVERSETQATLTTLTAADAKAALLRMLRGLKQPPMHFGKFNVDATARQPIEEGPVGTCWFGGFRIDLRQARYDIVFGDGCRFHHRGSFELRAGWWVATPPRLLSIACRKI